MDEDVLKDKRFRHVATDPRFRKVPKSERKVKIDQRFKAMFTDEKFKLKYAVDKRGRPVQQTQADNLKKYYELSSGSEGEDDELDESDSPNEEQDRLSGQSDVDSEGDESEAEGSLLPGLGKSDGVSYEEKSLDKASAKEKLKQMSKLIDSVHKGRMKEAIVEKLKDASVDYARGIGTLGSEESSSDESTSEEEEEVVHPWGELDKDAEETEEATARLAACNMDWDRITAKDLFVLFNSFLPAEGFVKSVVIYPSEFGIARMKEEELKGPKELLENPKFDEFEEDDFTDKHSDGNQYCMEKLREYQLNRLKYYYAVVTFDSAETGNKIYSECDGIEYESSATKLDLRFIPDDMEFDQEPKDSCYSMPDVSKYKPRLFINSALQQGTVNLTWDETDPNRVEFTRKLAGGGNVNDDDINAYVAASSEDEDEAEGETAEKTHSNATETDDPIAKYKALLSSVPDDSGKRKSNVDMEVSWGVGLGDENWESDSDDELDKSKKPIKNENPKKSSRKFKEAKTKEEPENAELQLLLAEDGADESKKSHFNFKDIQKEEKNKKKKKRKLQKAKMDDGDDKFEIDVNDKRFSALYTSHHFNIDPADPRFVRTEAAEKIIREKQKRRKMTNNEVDRDELPPLNKPKMNPELASLVKSIKGKHPGT